MEEEHRNKEKRREEEEEITATLQSSAAIQQSFTHGQGNCFFPVNKVEDKGRRRRRS